MSLELNNLVPTFSNNAVANWLNPAQHALLASRFVSVSDHYVRIFNLHETSDRLEYEKLMKELLNLVAQGRCIVWNNELSVLNNNWHRYLEWTILEFKESFAASIGSEPANGV